MAATFDSGIGAAVGSTESLSTLHQVELIY